ncbi:MAG: glycosyltransferase family 4 protein [Akkermansiaceae bacterium]|nr:glycosyltransferase family 4 protein [Akkermansiaceae bacterium]
MTKIRLAFIVVDDRFGVAEEAPRFGPAATAVLNGFAAMEDQLDVHVICCTLGELPSPTKLAPNIWFHSRALKKNDFLRSLHWGCIKAAKEMLAEIQPDIVHAQGTERWCAVAGLQFSGPKVLTIHGNLGDLNKGFTMRPRLYWGIQTLMHHFAVPRYDGVACVSNHVVDGIRNIAKKTWLIPNAIRPIFFKTPRTAARRSDRIVFLNIGVFAPWKRQDKILELAKQVWTKDKRAVFRFIGFLGPNEFGRKCMPLIEEGERLGFVELTGLKSPSEIIEELDAAHAMVHCPTEETFGLVVAEALSRDLKFFGSAIGGVKDITAGVPGCVLKSRDDWAGLESAILTWLSENAPMPSGSGEIIATRYAPEVAAHNHLAMYHELLEAALKTPHS